MRRIFSLVALMALLAAMAMPATAKTKTSYAMLGEARALELAIGDQGVTLGFSMTRANSIPEIEGVGAGQCTLLGDDAGDPDDLPCSEENTVISRYPGKEGSENPTCTSSLPEPLSSLIDLKLACGSSRSLLQGGLPYSSNTGKIAELNTKVPLDLELLGLVVPGEDVDDTVDGLIDDIADAIGPVIEQTPKEIQDALDSILDVVKSASDTQAVRVQLGPSVTKITPKGQSVTVNSSSAAARIGLVGLPTVDASGLKVAAADPLKNGLVIIEVGPSQASATMNRSTAVADAAASAAIVTVKVRDITSPTPKYVEVSVAPGQTVTVLEGTPLESTITAAMATTKEGKGTAQAAADAVRFHLLKGVNGGVKLGLSRSTAAINVDQVKTVPPTTTQKKPPTVLPVTGGSLPYTGIGVLLVIGALGALVTRRKVMG